MLSKYRQLRLHITFEMAQTPILHQNCVLFQTVFLASLYKIN